MADNPTRTDAPPPPPPRPPEQSLKPSPEFQQKLDDFRALKEARQDAGQYVDHRAGKAENAAARTDGAVAQQQRAGDKPQRPEGRPEPQGLRPSPEFQQKLDDFRAQKEARQDAGQYVDHRVAKAEREGTPHQTAGSRERQGGTQQKDSGSTGDKPPGPPGPPGPGPDGHDRRVYAAKHLKPEADLRGKTGPAEPVESTPPAGRPPGAHYRDEGTRGNDPARKPVSAANTDHSAQQQGIRDAVARAKETRLENALSDQNRDVGPRTAGRTGSPITDGPPEGPLIKEDPTNVHALGINGLKGAAMAAGHAGRPLAEMGLNAAAGVWEAKVTAEPGTETRTAGVRVGFDLAANAVKRRLGVSDPELNLDRATDAVRDRIVEDLDRFRPPRRKGDDDPNPLIR